MSVKNDAQTFDATKPWAGMVPVESVVRNPQQPRTSFPAAELKALGISMKAGQAQPCTVIPHKDAKRPKVQWMLVDGECRWRAAKESGMGELFVCYKPGVTPENLHRVSFASNFCRLSHTKEETARAIEKEKKAGLSYKEIGAIVGKTEVWALQMHQVLQLHPELLKFLDEADPATGRKLGMKVALLMVNQPREKQYATYLKVRCQSSSEQYHSVRQKAVVGSNRKPSDDFAYVTSLLNSAFGKLQTLANVGEVMLRRFDDLQCGELRARLEKIEEGAAKFRTGRLARVECQVGPVLLLMLLASWSEARTEFVVRWLAIGLGIFAVLVGSVWLAERGLLWMARALADARYRRGLEALNVPAGAPSAYTLLSKEDMQMLLVNAGLMASRRLQEDGCGLVRADVLGCSWNVSPVQMSVFLAWCRGKTVELPDGRKWVAFVKVDAEKAPHGAWIIFEREVVKPVVKLSLNVRPFQEAMERMRQQSDAYYAALAAARAAVRVPPPQRTTHGREHALLLLPEKGDPRS